MTRKFLVPISTDHIDFNINTPSVSSEGRLFWNNEEGTLDLGMKSDVIQSIGMEFYMPPTKNNSGEEIPNGSFVMATGVQGDRITIAKAVTNGSVDPMYMIGVATENIPNESEDGLITTHGIVRGFNTDAWGVGNILYPNPSVAGGLTNSKPDAPNIRTAIAIVLRKNINAGWIYVRMTNGSVLGGTDSNVKFASLADNHIISYNGTTGIWENQGLAAAISEVDGSGSGIDADLLDGQQGSFYAPLNSPTFTGTVTVPTPSVSGAAATKGYVDFVVSQVEGGGGGITDWNLYWQASW
jgi:hypothetical protein